jgi:transmembrane sensor
VTSIGTPLEEREIRAQAAVWVTDLHGPDRNPELEAGVRRWLAEDPRHAHAFELATEAWQLSGNPITWDSLPVRRSFFAANPTHRRARHSLAAAAALAILVAATFYVLRDPAISTGSAEQRTVDLADGTQLTLNANSRVLVAYTENLRKLTLTRGEALFNVAHDTHRPFEVIIGERKVIALGTRFEVRREEANKGNFTVTLIEGRVAVEPLSAPDALQVPTELPAKLMRGITLLTPGQRLHLTTNSPDAIDTPPIEKVTAWQRGQLIVEDTSIRDAAKEFNRYGKRRLTVDSSVPDTIHVGGVFRIGDPDSFAHAMANAHQLHLAETSNQIILTAP